MPTCPARSTLRPVQEERRLTIGTARQLTLAGVSVSSQRQIVLLFSRPDHIEIALSEYQKFIINTSGYKPGLLSAVMSGSLLPAEYLNRQIRRELDSRELDEFLLSSLECRSA